MLNSLEAYQFLPLVGTGVSVQERGDYITKTREAAEVFQKFEKAI